VTPPAVPIRIRHVSWLTASAGADIWLLAVAVAAARILRNQLPSTASTYHHHRCQPANEYPAKMFGLIGFVFGIEWFMGRMCLSVLLLSYSTAGEAMPSGLRVPCRNSSSHVH